MVTSLLLTVHLLKFKTSNY